MGSLFKQEQGITIFYRLCTGVSWVKNQSGDETDRLGRKGYHGGCGEKCMDLAGKITKSGRILICLGRLLKLKQGTSTHYRLGRFLLL